MRRTGLMVLLLGGLCLAGGCATPSLSVRPDAELERNTLLASGALAAGAPEKAALYYRQALERARLIDDPLAMGCQAYNLAACLALLQRDDEARAWLDEAAAEYARAAVQPPEIILLQARLARRGGQVAAARELLQSGWRPLPAKNPYQIQYQILISDLLCVQGASAAAAQALAEIPPKTLATLDPLVQADAAWVHARLALLAQQHLSAAAWLDTAAAHLQQAGQFGSMAQALDEAGQAYETAGAASCAVDRYYRAARSLLMSGATTRSAQIIAHAMPLAEQSAQEDLRQRLSRLQADLKARQTP